MRAAVADLRAYHTRLFEQNVQSEGLRVECDLAKIQELRNAYTPAYYALPWIPFDAVPPPAKVRDPELGVECWALCTPMPPVRDERELVKAYVGTLAKILCEGRLYSNRSAVYYDFVIEGRGEAVFLFLFLAITQS